MRSLKRAVLIASLAWWGGQAIAAPSPPRYSAEGLYNLANDYARAGKPGLAVLNYERAELLAPNDEDIRANLEYVRASAHVPPTERRGRLARLAGAIGPSAAAWIGVLGVALIGIGLHARRLTPRWRRLAIAGIPLGGLLMVTTVSSAMLLGPKMREAVVLVHETPARVAPAPMGDTAFVLREAETVTMVADHDEFVLIRTGDGRSGWVSRADVGAVVPQ